MSVAILNTCENPTVADYHAARERQPEAVIPRPGEPWAPAGSGLKVWASDGKGNLGWYYTEGDRFVAESI